MTIKFNYEEAALINNFFENSVVVKESAIATLEDAKKNTDDNELVDIAASTIKKLTHLDVDQANAILSDLPIVPDVRY